jgi:hypothetical protein
MAQILMSLLQLCYLVGVRPFTEPQDNALEIFNEGSILLILTCHLAFATGTDSSGVKAVYEFGYLVIELILFNISVNFLVFIWTNLRLINQKVLRPLRFKCERALKKRHVQQKHPEPI